MRVDWCVSSWFRGCAWTDVVADVWPWTYTDPDPDAGGILVVVLNVFWAALLTSGAAMWLAWTHTVPDDVWGGDTTDRDDVERSFLTGAFSFFVGWQWVIVLRDVTVSAYRQAFFAEAFGRWERPGIFVVGLTVS